MGILYRDQYNRTIWCWFNEYKGKRWVDLTDEDLELIADEYFEQEIYTKADEELTRRRKNGGLNSGLAP